MLDLRDQVTVFVISVQTPDLPDCLDALKKQDCLFRQDLIENIAPMDRAFQQMLERAKTPYFVQVDEDMILYPQAIRRLYEHLSNSPPRTAMFFLSLLDNKRIPSIDKTSVGSPTTLPSIFGFVRTVKLNKCFPAKTTSTSPSCSISLPSAFLPTTQLTGIL
jgi:hypothetical protein